MRKSSEGLDTNYILKVPRVYLDRLRDIWVGKFPYLSEGVRFLMRQEILKHGPIPKPSAAVRERVVKAADAKVHTD